MNSRSHQVRMWSMLCHLGALAGFLFNFGNILGPLIIWQIKKNDLPEINEHGKASVNFQLTVLIIQIIGGIIFAGNLGFGIFWRSPFYALSTGFGIAMILGIVSILSIVLAVIAGIRANDGGFFRYPAIRFIR